LLVEKTEQIIRNQDTSKPFFLYFATTLVHSSFADYTTPQFVMPEYTLRPPVFQFSDAFPERKRQMAGIQALDESFRRIVKAVVEKGIADNTIILFVNDNGAALPETDAFIHGANWGSNWPLRLGKGALFEGGVRVPSFIWSPLLKKRGRITDQLFHVTDWFPTLWEACGGDVKVLGDIDGMSQWQSIQGGLSHGPRKELVNNIDTRYHAYAMVYEDQYGGLYKIIGGNVFNNRFLGWRRPDGTAGLQDSEWKVWTPTTIECNFPPGVEVSKCVPNVKDCLFDIRNDPCELNNIADSYPSMLKLLQDKLHAYNATSIKEVNQPFDPKADPKFFDGMWAPWLDPMPVDIPILAYSPFSPETQT
jgi:arylsulfatase A-like enzyme